MKKYTTCFLFAFLFLETSLPAQNRLSQDPLKIHETLLLAEKDLDQGRSAQAESALQSIRSPSVWDFWKSVLLARANLHQEKHKEVLALLENLPPLPTSSINKNQVFYRRLYKLALETGRDASSKLSRPQQDWSLKLNLFFPETAQSLPSPEELSGSSSFSAAEKCRVFLDLGLALNRQNREGEALNALGRVKGSACEGDLSVRALYWKGTIEAKLKQYGAAAATFEALAKHSSDARYRDDAYEQLVSIYRAQGDAAKLEKALKRLLDLPEGDRKEKHLWDEAFAAYRDKNHDKAIKFLDEIIAMRSLGTEAQPQALYWKARIAENRAGKPLAGSSADGYRKVLKIFPFSFYAALAEGRLGKKTNLPAFAKLKVSVPSDRAVSDAIRAVDGLNRKGDHEAARAVMDYWTQAHPEAARSHHLLAAHRWMESWDFNQALFLAVRHFDSSLFDIRLQPGDPMTRALYPLAYRDDVERAARAHQLPQGLIEGISREESLFLPEVRSHAGAVGIMQLMPSTALREARRMGLPLVDLRSPEINIRIGSSFLKRMVNQFGGRIPYAVMAYNAGPGNVSKWLSSQGDLPLDEFIESIPFSETRGYVKRVLRSARIYGHLMGDSWFKYAP